MTGESASARTADIVARQRTAAVKMACRAIGLQGKVEAYVLTWRVRFTLAPDSSWTYDQLLALTEALGTTDIRFEYDGHRAGTEVTPGTPAEVLMWISWPRES
jgi:hypothetical protein